MMQIRKDDSCCICKGLHDVQAIPIKLQIWGRSYNSFAAVCKKCRAEKSKVEIERIAQDRMNRMFGLKAA